MGKCKRVGKVLSSKGLGGGGGSVSAITINYKQCFLSFSWCCIDYRCTCCISSTFVHVVLLADLFVLLLVESWILGYMYY